MLPRTRSALLLLGFLSLQLSLFGGGVDCAFAGVLSQLGLGARSAPVAIAGMDMAGGAMSPMHNGNDQGDSESDGDGQPCDDGHPTAGCDSMSVCVFAAVTAPSSAAGGAQAPPDGVPAVAVVTPPAERDAPEIPPPRA